MSLPENSTLVKRKYKLFLSEKRNNINALNEMCENFERNRPIDAGCVSYHKDSIDILILTATEIETDVLHLHIKDLETLIDGNQKIYHLGKIGLYNVVHAESFPGTSAHNASYDTTRFAIERWNPKVVISIGIAYGNDVNKLNLGDVVFISLALSYSGAKIAKDKILFSPSTGFFSPDPYLSLLLKYMSKFKRDFKLFSVSAITGENVIDNAEFKKTLFDSAESFRPAAGEMESYGIYKASQEAGVKYCFVLKGICDWGEGKNDLLSDDKDSIQRIATSNALSILIEALSDQAYFKPMGVLTTFDYCAITRLKDQCFQHPDLIKAIHNVSNIYNHYCDLYKLNDPQFLSDMKNYGYCDDHFNLTDKGILFLFDLPNFDPSSLYIDTE